jgi:uncharacterized FlgJ-related protein
LRPASPSLKLLDLLSPESPAYLLLKENKKKKKVFILELFKDNIKNNISIQNIFNLVFVSLKYQERLENSNTLRKTKIIEIRIQKDTFRGEYNKLTDRIIGLNQ